MPFSATAMSETRAITLRERAAREQIGGNLSPRRRAVLEAIERLKAEHGSATLRELAVEAGVTSTNSVWLHLQALRSLGLVEWEDTRCGTIALTKRGRAIVGARSEGTPGVFVPLVSCKRCGTERAGPGPCPSCGRFVG